MVAGVTMWLSLVIVSQAHADVEPLSLDGETHTYSHVASAPVRSFASLKRYPHWSENYLVYGNELFWPHPVSVIRGNCGYLVQSKFFDHQLWEGYGDAPPGAFFMDDVWISGRLAAGGVRRFVVPFDEDQFTMSPGLDNVTTLDHVELHKTRDPIAERRKQKQQPQPQAGKHRKDGRDNSERIGDIPSKFKKPAGGFSGNNRVAANEQALKHFKRNWDVLWDGALYKVVSASSAAAATLETRPPGS